MVEAGKNYECWQQSGWDWYFELLLRRPVRPVYGRQEKYLRGFLGAMAERWLKEQGRPLKVLEFGCGFGRHLKYLHQIESVEVHGCDQSPAMLSVAETLLCGRFAELKDRLKLVAPRGRLPYGDAQFDVVFTVSVLIHVSPEDLQGCIGELRRIARHMIVGVELPNAPGSFLWDEAHQGCWLHNFVESHHRAGPCAVEVDADVLSPAAVVYNVVMDGPKAGATRVLHGGRWSEEAAEVETALAQVAIEYGRFCRDQAQQTTQDVSAQMEQRNVELTERLADAAAQMEHLRQRISDLRVQLRALQQSRAVRAAQWLDRYPHLKAALKALYDASIGLARRLLQLVGLRKKPEPVAAAAPAAEAPLTPVQADSPEGVPAEQPPSAGQASKADHGHQ